MREMARPIFVLFALSLIVYGDCFRPVYMRKQTPNTTDPQKISSEFKNARKNFNYDKSKKMAYRAASADKKNLNSDSQSYRKSMPKSGAGEKSLESVVLSLNDGLKRILQQNNIQPNFLDGYAQQVINFFQSSGPMFRAAESKYEIKPEIVHFRSEKPTVKFELNARSLVALLKDVLKSESFNQNLDNIVRQAGLIFRTLQEKGIDKQV